MAPLGFDLNQEAPPGWDNPIDWEAIGEWEGPAHALGYNFVWDDGNNGAASFQRFSLFCAKYDSADLFSLCFSS